MPWVRFDDGFYRHRKVKGLSDAAYRLHTQGIMYAAEHLTDGFIASLDLDDVCPQVKGRKRSNALAELEARDMWKPGPLGWVIHDYLEYQPSAEQVKAERDAAKQRQQRYRDKMSGRYGARNGVTDALVTPTPTRPDPTRRGGAGRDGNCTVRDARDPHHFDDDGAGGCLRCPLPYGNSVHAVGDVA